MKPSKSTAAVPSPREILSLLLSFFLLTDPLVGTLIWLHSKKIMVKKEVERQIRAGMNPDALVLLKFSKSEAKTSLRWKNPREFEYNDEMYDVVGTITEGDLVHYWCWADEEESALNRQLEDLAAEALGKHRPAMANLAFLFSCFRSFDWTLPPYWRLPKPDHFGHPFVFLDRPYASALNPPPTPPPRLA